MTDIRPTDAPRTFSDLGLGPELLRALSALGYEEPTPIQETGIPPLLQRITKGGGGLRRR